MLQGGLRKTWYPHLGVATVSSYPNLENTSRPAIYGIVGMLLEARIDTAELLAVCAVVALAAYLLTRIAERLQSS